MPDTKHKLKGGSLVFDHPFNGKLRTDVDGMLIGETNFQKLVNFRYTADGIQGIQGMTPINVSALGYTKGINGFHFKKDQPTENHVFVQGVSGSNSILYKSNNTSLIPNQDTFANFQTLENNNPVYFSQAPNGAVMAMNGVKNRIWTGNEGICSSFIVYDPAGTFWYDYTDKINNTLSDVQNVATLAQTGGGIDTTCKALWHFDSALTDASGNAHTLTAVAAPGYVAGRFGNAISLNGTSQYLHIADHADFTLSGNIYTIECVVNVTAFATHQRPIYAQYTTNWQNSFQIYLDATGAVGIIVRKTGEADFNVQTADGVITEGVAHHIAVVQNNTLLYIFVDGVIQYQGTAPTHIQNYTGDVYIGTDTTDGGGAINDWFYGWIDELRVSSAARWTVPFSMPVTAYTASTSIVNIYVGSQRPLQGVKFYVGTANGSAATAAAFEWIGTAWNGLTVTDGTAISGKTLAKTGEIYFPSTVATSKLKAIKNGVAYYYHFSFTGIDSGTTIYYCTVDAPMQAVTDLWDGTGRTCLQCYQYTTSYTDFTLNVAPSTTNAPRAYVALDPSTYAQLGGMTSSQYIYAGFASRLMGFQLSMPDALYVNTTPNTVMLIDYWNGYAWVTVGYIDDSSSTGGVSLNHSGLQTWNAATENTEFQTSVADENQFYYYRIHFSQTLSGDVRVSRIAGITAQNEIRPYRFSVLWQNRLWMFNDQTDKKNTGICTAYGTNCVLNGNDSTEIEFGDSTELMAGTTLFSRFTSGIFDDLIIFKRTATYMFDGSGPSTWTLYQVSERVGCVAPLTVQRCDTSYAVAEGLAKHVIIWRSSRSIELFDGNSLGSIKDDIQSFFDPTSADYIDPEIYDVSKESSLYNENHNEYHWMFTNANGQQEWVYNLHRKKWSQVDRGTGKSLNGGLILEDAQGNQYVYGLTNDGFIERLHNGTTFDGNDMTFTFREGDNLLPHTGAYETKLRHIKLFAKAKNTSIAKISVTHYADTELVGTALLPISQVNTSRRLYQDKQSVNRNAVLHSLEYSVTTNDEYTGFEPLLITGIYEIVREDDR